MNAAILQQNLSKLLKQRNHTVMLLIAMLVANIVLGLALLTSSERVVIVPSNIKQKFWVATNKVSSAYVEEMAIFLINQLLDVSAASANYQRELILRHVAPEYYNVLNKRLQKEAEYYKEEQVATAFKPVEIDIDESSTSATITGDLISFVGTKRVSQQRDSYALKFRLKNNELLLTSFELLEVEL